MSTSNNEMNEDIDKEELPSAEYLIDKLRKEHIQQFSSDSKPVYLRNIKFGKGFKHPETSEESPIDMAKIINDINQFTANLEKNSSSIDWQQFRVNLLKIHRYYMKILQSMKPQNINFIDDQENAGVGIDLTQFELDIDNVMEPLNTLIIRSKTLSNQIEGVEYKINNLDSIAEEFYAKYNQTLFNREKAFNDMMTLQSMREKIGKRLSEIEMEMHASRIQLLQRGVQNK